MHRVHFRTISARGQLLHLTAMLALVAGIIASVAPALPVSPIQAASAHLTDSRLPVPSGENWSVLQGYNTSSNATTTTAATAPAVPTLATPANGTTYWASSYVATVSWGAVSGATSYQVVINDGAITSPWVSGASWTTGSLTPGQYAWQVKSRNANGESALSAKWVFWVEGMTLPTPPTTPQPLGVTLESSSGAPSLGMWATGGGMNASEKVDLYLDQASGTVLATATANAAGNWSAGISIPDATGGAHKIVAKGRTSSKSINA